MLLSMDIKQVLKDNNCQDIFRQFIQHGFLGAYAKPRFQLYLDIENYKQLAIENPLDNAKQIYNRYLTVPQTDTHASQSKSAPLDQIDPHVPMTMAEDVEKIKGILFPEHADQATGVDLNLFNDLLTRWLEHEISDWWKKFEKDPSLNQSEIKLIKEIYPDFRKNYLAPASIQNPARNSDAIEITQLTRAASRKEPQRISEVSCHSDSAERLSPDIKRKNPISPVLKRRKSKLSTTDSTSPPTPKKQTKTTHLSSFFKSKIEVVAEKPEEFAEPMINWNNETVCHWLAPLGSDELINVFRDKALTGKDLLELNINDLLSKNITKPICRALQFLISQHDKPNGDMISSWNALGVTQWLGLIGMAHYNVLFLRHHIDGNALIKLEKSKMTKWNIKTEDIPVIEKYLVHAINFEESVKLN